MKKRHLFSQIYLLIICLLLSGCGDHWQPHTRREVLAYVKDQFPGESISVAKDYTNPLLDNGKPSSDRIWECWFTDMPDVVFHVGSRRMTGHPAPIIDYSLYHDRDRVFREYYIKEYQTMGNSLSLWDIDTSGDLEFHFSSMADVALAAEQLRSFYSWYEAQPHAGPPHYAVLELDGLPLPSGDPITNRTRLNTSAVLASDFHVSFCRNAAEMEELCAEMIKSYYTFYRLPCADFSEEDLDAFAQENWDPAWAEGGGRSTVPHLSRDGKSVPVSLFSGIGAVPYAGSGLEFSYISYGGLFELLNRLGLEPVGELEHFTVTGVDGVVYEFSYSFHKTEQGETWWYYIQNGIAEPAQYSSFMYGNGYPILRIGGAAFQAVTGLTFYE